MKNFSYRALSADGQVLHGHAAAVDVADLEQRLTQRQLELLSVGPSLPWQRGSAPPRRELINFCFHLEQFLQAGVPILEALADLENATSHVAFRNTLHAVRSDIEGGATLSAALERHPQSFEPVFCSLVRAGEHAGELPTVLRELAASLKRDDEFAAFTRRIAIYPAIVATIILIAIAVALLHVVPELAKLFQLAGRPLPLQTRVLIGLSDLLRQSGLFLLLGGIVGSLAVHHALSVRPDLRRRRDALLLELPILGAVRRKLILARFTDLFGLMYRAGIPIVEALRIAASTLGNLPLQEGLHFAAQRIEQGRSLSESFHDSSVFPNLVTRMLRIGERTGALDQALANVSYFYERDVREAIARLQTSIEPMLTIVLGAFLVAVMSAVLLPIYDIVTELKL